MMKIFQRTTFVQFKFISLMSKSHFSIFKDLSEICEAQELSKYSIRQINSDANGFIENTKPFSKQFNLFIEKLYERQEGDSQRQFRKKNEELFSEKQRQLIADIIENRLLSIQHLQNVSNMQQMLLLLDFLGFAISFSALSPRFLDAFDSAAHIFSQDLSQISSITPALLHSICRIFTNASKTNTTFLDQLQFNIFTFTKKLLEISTANLECLDIKIELLQALSLYLTNGNYMSEYSPKTSFSQQFKSDQFYDLWITNENDIEENNELPQNISTSAKSLRNILIDSIFDSVLLKNDLQRLESLVLLLKCMPLQQLNEIPAECYILQCEKHQKQIDNLIDFMETSVELKIFEFKVTQKLALYQNIYNFIGKTCFKPINPQSTCDKTIKNITVKQISRLCGIMSISGIVDFIFLKQLEQQLSEANQMQKLSYTDFYNVLKFFGKFPLKMDILTKNQINYYVNNNFENMSNSQKIAVSVNLLKLENQPNAPIYLLVQLPLFCTLQNMSLLTNYIIQFNTQPRKSLQEKIQFYFLLKTFFRDSIKVATHLEEQIVELKDAFFRAGFTRTSFFQKQVFDDLLMQDAKENPKSSQLKSFKSEIFLEDIFSIDYLINEDIVLEVNGYRHYFLVSSIPKNYESLYQDKYIQIDTISDAVNFNEFALIENRNTRIKSDILSKTFKYKYRQIPISLYQKYKLLNKHHEFVYEAVFSSTNIQDLKKII